MSALALKILLEGNTGDQKRPRLFSLSLNVYNCYLMNMLDGPGVFVGNDSRERCS